MHFCSPGVQLYRPSPPAPAITRLWDIMWYQWDDLTGQNPGLTSWIFTVHFTDVYRVLPLNTMDMQVSSIYGQMDTHGTSRIRISKGTTWNLINHSSPCPVKMFPSALALPWNYPKPIEQIQQLASVLSRLAGGSGGMMRNPIKKKVVEIPEILTTSVHAQGFGMAFCLVFRCIKILGPWRNHPSQIRRSYTLKAWKNFISLEPMGLAWEISCPRLYVASFFVSCEFILDESIGIMDYHGIYRPSMVNWHMRRHCFSNIPA